MGLPIGLITQRLSTTAVTYHSTVVDLLTDAENHLLRKRVYEGRDRWRHCVRYWSVHDSLSVRTARVNCVHYPTGVRLYDYDNRFSFCTKQLAILVILCHRDIYIANKGGMKQEDFYGCTCNLLATGNCTLWMRTRIWRTRSRTRVRVRSVSVFWAYSQSKPIFSLPVHVSVKYVTESHLIWRRNHVGSFRSIHPLKSTFFLHKPLAMNFSMV